MDLAPSPIPAARLDLDAYCARIGYVGPRTPTLDALRALQELHPAAIPFEAIDVLLGRGVDLSPAAIEAKLIGRGRGGYCFEQNLLFKRVLMAFGFEVEGLLGRVRWMAPPDTTRPRTHMALRVGINGESWLADVGFGGRVPTAPLRFGSTEPQPTRHECFRLAPSADGFVLAAQLGEAWQPLYELSREPQLDVDYEVPNWFTSTHPASPFRHDLLVARTTPRARYTLTGNGLTVRYADGGLERRTLSAEALERSLAEIFGLPVEPAWRPVLERAVAAGSRREASN
jgi:N-hydroxyarylamine O-acetyltransferase